VGGVAEQVHFDMLREKASKKGGATKKNCIEITVRWRRRCRGPEGYNLWKNDGGVSAQRGQMSMPFEGR